MTRGIEALWPDGRPLIGMVHLPALPGAPGWAGRMERVVEAAERDATALAEAGFDGLIVENYSDVPFLRGSVPPETVAALTRAVLAVRAVFAPPVGVNVLRNDARAALGIAAATGASFIRVNVHTGAMWTDQGLIEGRAGDTMRARAALASDVRVLADIHVKHATPPAEESLEDAARDAWSRGRADALVVSGAGTGRATAPDDLRRVRAAVADAPLLVGSGATPGSVRSLLDGGAGVIVGSAIMRDGMAGAGVDATRARAFVEAARG